MIQAPFRPVRLWQPEILWDRRADGAVVVRQAAPLGPYPRRMADRIAFWAARAPERVWMAERGPDGGWRRMTYGDLQRAMRALGQAFLDLGLSAERPLVILSGNSIAHALAALGAQYAGIPSAAVAPAYALMGAGFEKLTAVRDQITPGAVFAEDTRPFARALSEVFPALPVLGREGPGLARPWDELLTTVPGSVAEAHAATGPETVAKFLFTSGTTGAPKAVIQTQRMLCANIEQVTDCYAYLRDEPPVILDWAPWNHVAGGNLIFHTAIHNGGTFWIDGGRPTREAFPETLKNLREVATTWYWNVPYGFEMLAEAMEGDEGLARAFFRDLKFMYYAGAAMAAHTWAALDRLALRTTGERIILTTGLGATETAPFALFNTDPLAGPGNVGVPGRGVELKLVPVEGKWEARIRGPNVTPGYWRNEALTRAAFDEEGFYCLGDALRFADPLDPAKGFFFDGRLAENFKMATGTWVAVGPLRAALTDALGGLMRDAVILGEGRGELAALLIPFRPAVERLVPGGAGLPDLELFNHPVLRAEVARRLSAWNARAGGASLRVPRAMVLAEPLHLDRGEVTDKGSVNQRAVRMGRADLAEALYAGAEGTILA